MGYLCPREENLSFINRIVLWFLQGSNIWPKGYCEVLPSLGIHHRLVSSYSLKSLGHLLSKLYSHPLLHLNTIIRKWITMTQGTRFYWITIYGYSPSLVHLATSTRKRITVTRALYLIIF
jgi:hypothetical protein